MPFSACPSDVNADAEQARTVSARVVFSKGKEEDIEVNWQKPQTSLLQLSC